jgi:two-component system, chemotaxis family, CheB/CheR fusion protein
METPQPETPKSKEPSFSVVGIGASAGGLEALRDFFGPMPEDTGAAFVIIQHLEPHHESMLAQVLTPFTKMNVVQVEGRMAVEPNRVYVIPPNRYLALSHGTLQLTAREPHRMPIDFFFRSLAEDQKERSICVILSGTGSDGTLGAWAVNTAGGAVYVQEPKSAKYDGMPRSAIGGGVR